MRISGRNTLSGTSDKVLTRAGSIQSRAIWARWARSLAVTAAPEANGAWARLPVLAHASHAPTSIGQRSAWGRLRRGRWW